MLNHATETFMVAIDMDRVPNVAVPGSQGPSIVHPNLKIGVYRFFHTDVAGGEWIWGDETPKSVNK